MNFNEETPLGTSAASGDSTTIGPEKSKLLRQIVESLMWELDAVRQGRWEELPTHASTKAGLLERLKAENWAFVPSIDEDPEFYFIQGQIRDLEYQLKRMVESQLKILQTQLQDLQYRTKRWKTTLAPYQAALLAANA